MELSCRTLYMHCVGARMTGAQPAAECGPDPWGHEPPAILAKRSASDLFEDIRETLAEADVLRLNDVSWMRDDDLRERLEALVHEFRSRGGRVETRPSI